MRKKIQISLKNARVNAKMAQVEAAKRIGISRATLQNYETGKTVPDVLVSRKIGEVYGIPVDCILFGRDSV